jgi:8-oxo-dGTP diphosphatase
LRDGSFIPPAASHYVGVGGVVLSADDELLVVQEKRHILTRPGFYKLPGGLIDQGETIAQAAEREVWEETGVRAEFDCLVGYFSHQLTWQLEKSALYLVGRLKPLSRKITIDEQEIAEAKWMPAEEFMALETTHAFNKNLVQMVRKGIGMRPVDWSALPDSMEVFAPA